MKTFSKVFLLSILLAGCFGTLPAKSQNTIPPSRSSERPSDPSEGVVQPPNESVEAAGDAALLDSISFYQNRYVLRDPYTKLVDNVGEGFNNLYGVRNFRAVLNGVVYRGGANNVYNKNGKRSNMNPLPNEGLKNLCEEGFGTAVYLYTTNYKTAPPVTTCKNTQGEKHALNYLQKSPQANETDADYVLKLIYKKLKGEAADSSPVYLHCWNGWHASGFISAITLRQFCDYTADQAVNYWNINTDGHNEGSTYDKLRKAIRAFKPDPSMKIEATIKAQICPSTKNL